MSCVALSRARPNTIPVTERCALRSHPLVFQPGTRALVVACTSVRPSRSFIRCAGVNLGATTNTVGTWNICCHLPRNACCARYKFRYNGNTVLSGLYVRREFSARSRISFRETRGRRWQKGGRIFVHAINLRYISVRKNHYTAEEIIGPVQNEQRPGE